MTDHHPSIPIVLDHIYYSLKKRLAMSQPSRDNLKINAVSLSSIGITNIGTNDLMMQTTLRMPSTSSSVLQGNGC